MKNEFITGLVGTGLSAVGTGLQPNELLEIISLVITIIGGLITFVIIPLINWYKQSKQDGKITKDEIKEGVDIIKDGAEKVKGEIERKDK